MPRAVRRFLTGAGARALATVAALVACCFADAAETMRCEAGLISTGDTRQRVLAACGAPLRSFVEKRPIWVTNHLGARVEVLVEREVWVYDRGYGRFIGLLVFENETLRRIEYGPRRD